MFCKECGTKIPDDAQLCPYCGEVLELEEKNQIETHTLDNKLEDDFNLHLDWVTESSVVHQYMRTKIYLHVEKLSSFPIYGTKVELSGPPQIDLIIKSRKIHPKKSTNTIFFPISSKKPGVFTLIATLTSDAGHRIVLPIKIQVEPSKTLYSEEPLTKPALQTTHYPTRNDDLVGARIIVGIIGVILIFAGTIVTTSGGFGSGLPFGISLVIIGVVMLGIVTKGVCCYAGVGCGDCDCGDCDC